MSLDGEPLYIEVPSDNRVLEDAGADRNQLKRGGNYAYCLRSDLSNNK